MRRLLAAALLAGLACAATAQPSLQLGELPLAGPPYSVFVAPGETVRLTVRDAERWELRDANGPVGDAGADDWSWPAPETAGLVELELVANGQTAPLRIWVGTPLSANSTSLSGYRIGNYPPPRPGAVDYTRPRALFGLEASQTRIPVSRHFTIGQFLCKQRADWPRFLRLDARLLTLLDTLVAELRARGHDIDTLGVISGYRTPLYNAAIGNVPYSRHVFGDAMDVYVDADGDGRMDDLDGNGRQDVGDLELLRDLAASIMARDGGRLSGGLGIYPARATHGGFVHIDTRGVPARW